ncbi:BTB/POZ-like protein [Corchorus olitorius]|uniref:BTB/POZ-like protein n=1 Tax=Corchorus olitorius TaxID=93759 RepID=A0A1R3FWG1_9ROSI|nr:BTB/POZ-like protein [Corchorus olitorius]
MAFPLCFPPFLIENLRFVLESPRFGFAAEGEKSAPFLDRLESALESICDVITVADEWQFPRSKQDWRFGSPEGERFQIIMEEVQNALDKAVDLVYEIVYKSHIGKLAETEFRISDFIKQLAEQLEKIRDRIGKTKRGLRKVEARDALLLSDSLSAPASLLHDETVIYGRDKDRAAIVRSLLTGADNFDVITLYGENGVGKTTLAQLVYKDENVSAHFDLKAWISVPNSDDFASGNAQLRASFAGKKVLLVLDDVRSSRSFYALKDSLESAVHGSMILNITSYPMSIHGSASYRLDPLAEYDCWSVLAKSAFLGKDSNEEETLEDIGKKIVQYCRDNELELVWTRDIKTPAHERAKKDYQELSQQLEKPSIGSYGALESLPVDGLPRSLIILSVSFCDKITPEKGWELDELESLSHFEIEGGCQIMESFPEKGLLPETLNSLRISRLSNLKSLDGDGLQELTCLQTLEINCCDKLNSLPEYGLPSSLSSLSITDCSLLNPKLHNRKGEEWLKIAHIPSIYVDEPQPLANLTKWITSLKDIEDDLNKKISFLSGLVVTFREQIHTDIQLKPGNNGHCIPAHRALLAARSEIFKNMLDSDGCKAPPSDTITLPELNTEELESLLEFLYSGNLPSEKLEKHAYSLFVAADKYEIPYLQEFCERFLLNSLNASNALEILEISDICSNKILKETALNFIVRNMEDIVFSASSSGTATTTAAMSKPQPHANQVAWMNDLKDKKVSFLSGLVEAFKEQIHTDIQLKPGNDGPCIPAHRVILASRSEIFKNMLDSDGCKAPVPPSHTITLPELNSEELKSLLEFLYSGTLPLDKLEKHVNSLLIAADKYGIQYLQEFCQCYLLNSLNVSNVLDVLETSEARSNKELKESAMNFIFRNMEDVVLSDQYEALAAKNPQLSMQITKGYFMNARSEKVSQALDRHESEDEELSDSDETDDDSEASEEHDDREWQMQVTTSLGRLEVQSQRIANRLDRMAGTLDRIETMLTALVQNQQQPPPPQ